MTPEQLAKPGTEHAHQVALFAWCALQDAYPVLKSKAFFAIPNGGSRGDTAESAKIVGGRLKAEGVKAGVGDMFLALPVGIYAGLFLELKRLKKAGVGPSDDQLEFGELVQSHHYAFKVAYGWEEARDALIAYMKGL